MATEDEIKTLVAELRGAGVFELPVFALKAADLIEALAAPPSDEELTQVSWETISLSEYHAARLRSIEL